MPLGGCAVCGSDGATQITDEGFAVHPNCMVNMQIDPASRAVEENKHEDFLRAGRSRAAYELRLWESLYF
jgi:hypothetical protein